MGGEREKTEFATRMRKEMAPRLDTIEILFRLIKGNIAVDSHGRPT